MALLMWGGQRDPYALPVASAVRYEAPEFAVTTEAARSWYETTRSTTPNDTGAQKVDGGVATTDFQRAESDFDAVMANPTDHKKVAAAAEKLRVAQEVYTASVGYPTFASTTQRLSDAEVAVAGRKFDSAQKKLTDALRQGEPVERVQRRINKLAGAHNRLVAVVPGALEHPNLVSARETVKKLTSGSAAEQRKSEWAEAVQRENASKTPEQLSQEAQQRGSTAASIVRQELPQTQRAAVELFRGPHAQWLHQAGFNPASLARSINDFASGYAIARPTTPEQAAEVFQKSSLGARLFKFVARSALKTMVVAGTIMAIVAAIMIAAIPILIIVAGACLAADGGGGGGAVDALVIANVTSHGGTSSATTNGIGIDSKFLSNVFKRINNIELIKSDKKRQKAFNAKIYRRNNFSEV